MAYEGIENADRNTSYWNTPGPWLGMLMGFGTPLLLFVHLRLGWIAGLVVLAAMVAIAVAITLRLSGEHVVRVYGSRALMRYNTRFMLAMMAYVVGMLIAMAIYNDGMPAGPLAYAVTLLPALPALAMIVVMARYLVEEQDEYLRHRASFSAIIGLGLVLVLGTTWGFLETFGLVPHIWAWWVLPVWAIGLGIGQALVSRHERMAEADHEDDQPS
jgi:hypothetical protein